jgi:uncharacterized protein YbjT (DUF2867 family)
VLLEMTNSPARKATIAIAGASGFVGTQLRRALGDDFRVIGLARRAHEEAGVEWRACDLYSATSTFAALEGVDVAFYLVHSMMPSSSLFQGSFHDTDLMLADNFARACAHHGVKQIVYLGGLIPEEGFVSAHLTSRHEVEAVLQSSGVPVTCLRAGMVVGPEGSSFEILRALVQRLPWMVLPRWTRSRSQAVYIDDVVAVLRAAILNPAFVGKTLDLVNGETLSYENLLRQTAEAMGKKRFMLPVPIASTGFWRSSWRCGGASPAPRRRRGQGPWPHGAPGWRRPAARPTPWPSPWPAGWGRAGPCCAGGCAGAICAVRGAPPI